MPANDRHAFCRIKHLPFAAVEPITCKHFLWSPRGHVGKDWSAIGHSHPGRPRQIENVITVQEHPEHVRAADYANAAIWHPESNQGLLEREAAANVDAAA